MPNHLFAQDCLSVRKESPTSQQTPKAGQTKTSGHPKSALKVPTEQLSLPQGNERAWTP